jgi:mycothiol synthase
MTSTRHARAISERSFDPGLLQRVVAAATAEDGVEPLNEAALLALQHRGLEGTTLLVSGPDDAPEGFAWVHGSEVDLVVAPAARRRGVGTALGVAAVSAAPDAALSAWSHGNHPAAARLAERLGFARVRDLWVMRRPLTDLPPLDDAAAAAREAGVAVRTFRPGIDEEPFLALNAEAFAGHPEQGAMTRADLDQRMAEPWFDAAGFFVAERAGGGQDAEKQPAGRAPEGGPVAGGLLGFHWTKVHDGGTPHGEVYVVGVSPAAQGLGLGRLLTLTGLHHLAGLGLDEVVLYVESDNAPAIAVYSRLGFTHAAADTHVMYRREVSAGRP